MIKRAYSAEELSVLPPKGVEAQKIRALLYAYGTKYDFCRFYVSDNVIFCGMNGSFVLCELDESSEFDISEICGFLTFGGFSDIFCSEHLGGLLSKQLSGVSRRVNSMRFCGTAEECCNVEKEPPLDEVYKILSTAFEIDYETWYTDMSHRIRHGIAKARMLGNSALIIQHDINGEALLSQIVTLPEKRGIGNASRLVSSVCAELSASEVFVICDDLLLPFYQKNEFEETEKKFIITRHGE